MHSLDVIFCGFISHLIGHKTINIPDISLVFTVLRERVMVQSVWSESWATKKRRSMHNFFEGMSDVSP